MKHNSGNIFMVVGAAFWLQGMLLIGWLNYYNLSTSDFFILGAILLCTGVILKAVAVNK